MSHHLCKLFIVLPGGAGGGGGGFFSGLGSKPSAENAGKNVFGAGSLGSAAPQTGLFGNTSTSGTTSPFQSSVFGGSTTSGATGNGSFSSSGGPVANTGFAVATPQTPAGFGGSSTFGGSPSFGGSPTFGSPPVFGGTSTFASPLTSPTGGGGGFGGFAASGSPTFGSVAASSPAAAGGGFGSFAQGQGNASSFGSLAHQNTDQASGSAFGSGGGGAFGRCLARDVTALAVQAKSAGNASWRTNKLYLLPVFASLW
ncbi:Nuclear pore complex protein Nup214 [Chionoecetes opilio]|uniref:Nuclear pore complex protein Nup214 n=1 Tax=Chionoecetes opilio TaxID=41210 RepID=A0A8J5CKH8_CHIOP|nr:Nuclear pore complex protein Nup214 [Chionoecetes opilio]